MVKKKGLCQTTPSLRDTPPCQGGERDCYGIMVSERQFSPPAKGEYGEAGRGLVYHYGKESGSSIASVLNEPPQAKDLVRGRVDELGLFKPPEPRRPRRAIAKMQFADDYHMLSVVATLEPNIEGHRYY